MTITRKGTYDSVKGSVKKLPCKVATTTAHGLSGLADVDGVPIVAGDRVLEWNHSPASGNGIYVAASGAWSRAIDMSLTDDVFMGAQVYINSGSTYGGETFTLTTPNPITLGSTSLTFQRDGFITNRTDSYTSVANVKYIVTLTSAEFSAIVTKDPNTQYNII